MEKIEGKNNFFGVTEESLHIKGEYTFFSLAPWVQKTDKLLNDIRFAIRNKNKAILEALKGQGIILEMKEAINIIPLTGRNVLARLLAGDGTYTGEINWGALGNGSSPSFTNASTQLVNEVYRMQATSQVFDENIVYIDWFFAAGDVADQAFTEWGAFIDGSASADSGQAWSLLAVLWQKSGSMFVSAKYTVL